MRTWMVAAALLGACGGDDDDGDDVAAAPDAAIDSALAPDAAGAAQLTVGVPATLAGTPRQLAVVVHDEPALGGIPDGILYQDDDPDDATAGAALELALDVSATEGTYHVTAVLYIEGGGQFIPESGVDYLGTSGATFDFTGAPIDLGRIDLALAP